MKRTLLRAAIVLGLLLAMPGAVIGVSLAGLPRLPESEDLGESVRLLKDGHVSMYVLEAGPGQVALVDAGNDARGRVLLAELRRRGLGPEAVVAIFLTHGHADHTAATARFPRARVYALAEDVPLVEGRGQVRGPLNRWFPRRDVGARVTHPLKDGERVTVGSLTVRAFAVPGHTPGSAAYLARGVLFLGDSADATRKGTLAPALFLFSDDTEQARASLRALARRLEPLASEVRMLAFSHSGPVSGFAPLRAFAREP